eukprot:204504-Chlamydomonas_euryale.AAC.5
MHKDDVPLRVATLGSPHTVSWPVGQPWWRKNTKYKKLQKTSWKKGDHSSHSPNAPTMVVPTSPRRGATADRRAPSPLPYQGRGGADHGGSGLGCCQQQATNITARGNVWQVSGALPRRVDV